MVNRHEPHTARTGPHNYQARRYPGDKDTVTVPSPVIVRSNGCDSPAGTAPHATSPSDAVTSAPVSRTALRYAGAELIVTD